MHLESFCTILVFHYFHIVLFKTRSLLPTIDDTNKEKHFFNQNIVCELEITTFAIILNIEVWGQVYLVHTNFTTWRLLVVNSILWVWVVYASSNSCQCIYQPAKWKKKELSSDLQSRTVWRYQPGKGTKKNFRSIRDPSKHGGLLKCGRRVIQQQVGHSCSTPPIRDFGSWSVREFTWRMLLSFSVLWSVNQASHITRQISSQQPSIVVAASCCGDVFQ